MNQIRQPYSDGDCSAAHPASGSAGNSSGGARGAASGRFRQRTRQQSIARRVQPNAVKYATHTRPCIPKPLGRRGIAELQRHVEECRRPSSANSRAHLFGAVVIEMKAGGVALASRVREAAEIALKECVAAALQEAGGNVARAAEILGVNRTYAYRLVARHGIAIARKKPEPVSVTQRLKNWRRRRA